jgi:hypothetical protein
MVEVKTVCFSSPILAKFDVDVEEKPFASISLQVQMEQYNQGVNIITNYVNNYIFSSDIQNAAPNKLKSLNSDYFGFIDNYQNFILSLSLLVAGTPVTVVLYVAEYIMTLAALSASFTVISALCKPILNSMSAEMRLGLAPVKDGALAALSIYSDIFLTLSLIKAIVHADLWFGMRVGFLLSLKYSSSIGDSFLLNDTEPEYLKNYYIYKKTNVKELTYMYNIGL